MFSNHFKVGKKFEKEVKNPFKKELEKEPTKKRPNMFGDTILNFFVTKDPFKKDDVKHEQFVEVFALLIIKNHLPMHFFESK